VLPDPPRLGRFRRVGGDLAFYGLIGVEHLPPPSRVHFILILSLGLSCPFPPPFHYTYIILQTIRTHMTEQRLQFSFLFLFFFASVPLRCVHNVICWSVLGRYIPVTMIIPNRPSVWDQWRRNSQIQQGTGTRERGPHTLSGQVSVDCHIMGPFCKGLSRKIQSSKVT